MDYDKQQLDVLPTRYVESGLRNMHSTLVVRYGLGLLDAGVPRAANEPATLRRCVTLL